MGCFSLAVETTARDVTALLELHKVHPQVRDDVKRILNALMEKTYEHVSTTKSGYQEPVEQICRTMAADLVDRALTVAIPRRELSLKEQENAALQQQIVELKSKVTAHNEEYTRMEAVLKNFHSAHNYMLHSYFREVLVLRQRVNDLERQRKSKTNGLHTGVPSPFRMKKIQPQQSSPPADFNSTNAYRNKPEDSGETRPGVLGDVLSKVGAHGSPFSGASGIQESAADASISMPSVMQTSVTEGEAGQLTSEAANNGSQSHMNAGGPQSPSSHGNPLHNTPLTAHDVVPHHSKMLGTASMSNQEMLRVLASPSTQDSVDAIFDYEEYIARLYGGKDAMAERLRQLEEDERKFRERQSLVGRHPWSISASITNFADDTLLEQLEKELRFYKTQASKVEWCLQFAVRPVKHDLRTRLDEIREEMVELKKTQTNFFETMTDMMMLIQSRCDALEEVFSTFNEEVLLILQMMKKDANTKNCSELFMNSGKRRNKLEMLFVSDSSTALDIQRDAQGNIVEDINEQQLRRYVPWRTRPTVLKARQTLTALETFADKQRRKRAFFLSKGGENVEWNYRNLFNRNENENRSKSISRVTFVTGEGAEGAEGASAELTKEEIEERWRTALVEGTLNMRGEDLLKELVMLRMRRACNRMRRSHLVNRILGMECMEDGDEGANAETKQILSSVCNNYEGKISRDTRRIAELLRLLARHFSKLGVPMSELLGSFLEEEGSDRRSGTSQPFYVTPYLHRPDAARRGDTRHDARRRMFYMPVGTYSQSCVFFNDEEVPISSFHNQGNGDEDGGVGTKGRRYSEIRTPYGAAVDFCNGVQRGMPVGSHFGPVFLRNEKDGNSYIGDENGNNLLRDAERAKEDGFKTTEELRDSQPPEGRYFLQNAVPMTQIIFPAPKPRPTTDVDAAGVDAEQFGTPAAYMLYAAPGNATDSPRPYMAGVEAWPQGGGELNPSELQPIYLVPLTTPATDGENLRAGFGHTATSGLFRTDATGATAPLSVSFAHLLDPTTNAQPPRTFNKQSTNPYLYDPPRVCKPPTEEQELLRIQSLPIPSQTYPPPTSSATANEGDAVLSAPFSTIYPPSALTTADGTPSTQPLYPSPEGLSPRPPPTVPAAPPIASFETALQRAKQLREERLALEAAAEEESRCKRKDSWVTHLSNPTEVGQREKYLRMRLPGCGRLNPLKPSPLESTQIQKKIRLPSVGPPSAAPATGNPPTTRGSATSRSLGKSD